MHRILQDLRFAFRRLLKDRWFTLAAIAALALGIGANSIMPPGLKWPFQHEVWVPMSQLPPVLRARGRQGRGYIVYGRLAGGVTLEQSRSEMTNIG